MRRPKPMAERGQRHHANAPGTVAPRPLEPSADFVIGDNSPGPLTVGHPMTGIVVFPESAGNSPSPRGSRHDHKFTTGNETSELAIAPSANKVGQASSLSLFPFPKAFSQ
jgi:hypothetical protein